MEIVRLLDINNLVFCEVKMGSRTIKKAVKIDGKGKCYIKHGVNKHFIPKEIVKDFEKLLTSRIK